MTEEPVDDMVAWLKDEMRINLYQGLLEEME